MTALIVIASILLFLLLLLLAPVSIRFSCCKGDIGLKLCYLFLRFDLSPEALAKKAERKAAKGVKKEYRAQKKEADTKADKLKGAGDTVKTVVSLLRASKGGLNLVRHNLVIYKLRLRIVVAREDAHQTAVAYGLVSTATAVALSIVGELFVLRPGNVHVSPDFTKDKSEYTVSVRARLQPLIVLIAAVKIALAYLKVVGQNKRARVRKKSKGGHLHESATSHQ